MNFPAPSSIFSRFELNESTTTTIRRRKARERQSIASRPFCGEIRGTMEYSGVRKPRLDENRTHGGVSQGQTVDDRSHEPPAVSVSPAASDDLDRTSSVGVAPDGGAEARDPDGPPLVAVFHHGQHEPAS